MSNWLFTQFSFERF